MIRGSPKWDVSSHRAGGSRIPGRIRLHQNQETFRLPGHIGFLSRRREADGVSRTEEVCRDNNSPGGDRIIREQTGGSRCAVPRRLPLPPRRRRSTLFDPSRHTATPPPFFQHELRRPRNFSWPPLPRRPLLYCSAFVALHLQITTRGTAKQSAGPSSASRHSFPSFLPSFLSPFRRLVLRRVPFTRDNV